MSNHEINVDEVLFYYDFPVIFFQKNKYIDKIEYLYFYIKHKLRNGEEVDAYLRVRISPFVKEDLLKDKYIYPDVPQFSLDVLHQIVDFETGELVHNEITRSQAIDILKKHYNYSVNYSIDDFNTLKQQQHVQN